VTDSSHEVVRLNAGALRRWPLPALAPDDDKEDRGRILVIGGSREMPGAVILAAEAALRAGAGKLSIATCRSVAQLVALAIPESRVIALDETARGGVAPASARSIDAGDSFDAVLIGPGMVDEPATSSFVRALLPKMGHATIVLDACAMGVVRRAGGSASPSRRQASPRRTFRFAQPVALTPHAGEMAHLMGIDKREVEKAPLAHALHAAARWNAAVALKGATTFIGTAGGKAWQHDGGNVGLAISGSGDVLSGIVAGLASRGASPEQALAWGVVLHARAGDRLARRFGKVGYLARELAREVPGLMASLGG
jgi:ADP-dependent NAD(P)H-hydrate dehydratase